ncbi:MAG: excinuclease ABC subunit UvrA [Planctomycetota bacterium]
MSADCVQLRGVRVHNLQSLDLDLPLGKLIAFCGVSGSGKTSLALDTLYAEGQRRYIESFSTYTRQFLEQLDKPDAEAVEAIPPSIAITRKSVSRSSRATVGSSSQINEHLQMLFAKIGRVVCYGCGNVVKEESAESTVESIRGLPEGARVMIGFPSHCGPARDTEAWLADLKALGYRRLVVDGRTIDLDEKAVELLDGRDSADVVLDRLKNSDDQVERTLDSLESALAAGRGVCRVWAEHDGEEAPPGFVTIDLDERPWITHSCSTDLRCEECGIEFVKPEPQLLNYNNPLGACPTCEGFGNVIDVDMNKVVPDTRKSIRDGAIAPWNTPAYKHELDELLELAPDYGIPVATPFEELAEEHLALIRTGVPERDFGGLDGFFQWLERRKYKMHLRVFLSRWRSYYPCSACGGARLRQEALAVQIAGRSFADVAGMKIRDAIDWLRSLRLDDWQESVGRLLLEQITYRLDYLNVVGVGHLTIDRPLRTLSGGEAQRVALTSALGSNLVGMLYVLDEPCAGLHPADVPRLVQSVEALRDRGNTVAVVEHEPQLIAAADHVVELGPGAGEAGGRLVYEGTVAGMIESTESRTGDWVSGRRGGEMGLERRENEQGWLRLIGARGNNLQDVSVEFPLGVLCAVTGVSGSGKTTLVERTLFPAVARALGADADTPLEHDELLGASQVEDAVMIDQGPIGRSPRSNPVTAVKAFDPIRALFAESVEAQSMGFTASHFSFNVKGGRCESCAGEGYTQVDMRFVADVYMKCAECQGNRYRREVLQVKHRGCTIADVLNFSVREAFTFFRGQRKILTKLQSLLDVGLDYLRLGQPANTLSGGESQRLKLATYIAAPRKGRTLFVFDEPTTGLHFSDVLQLLDCFESLLELGHSIVTVDHNPLVMKAADYLIDLGPGAAEEGGQVVAVGTPEQIAADPDSVTGRVLTGELGANLYSSAAAGGAG